MKLKLEKIEELIVNLKSYTNSTIELVQLEAAQHISAIIAKVASGLIVWVVIILFTLFLSLGISFYLSDLLGNLYWGFGIVAGIYLLLGLILIIGRKKLLMKPINDQFIREIFQK
ncbi:MAG: phage holin family protein [Prolixibacteraceae bacterium]|nr:phage holin family protein [Prolixibacteraceae bacterium]